MLATILSFINSIMLTATENNGALSEFMTLLKDNVLEPVMITAMTALPPILTNYISKFYKNLQAKNEIDSLAKVNEMKTNLLKEIETIVVSAVGSNMQLADKMKENGEKITEEQKKSLNDSARTIIMNSLPESLTDDKGVLLDIIGGKDKLNTIIDSMMEKAVYDYKQKKNNGINNPNVTVVK